MKHPILAITAAALIGVGALTSCAFSSRLRTEAISRPLADVERATISIEAGVAAVSLGALDGPGLLVEGTVDVPENSGLDAQYRVSEGVADLSYREEGTRRVMLFPGGGSKPHWELALTREVPLDLRVRSGVGESVLDLARLRVERLNLATGVGRAEVVLPERGFVEARIESGVGSVHVKVPSGTEVRVRSETGLGRLHLSGRSLEGQDGDYRTPGYGDATDRIDLEVRSGIGEVTVEVY